MSCVGISLAVVLFSPWRRFLEISVSKLLLFFVHVPELGLLLALRRKHLFFVGLGWHLAGLELGLHLLLLLLRPWRVEQVDRREHGREIWSRNAERENHSTSLLQ